MAFDADTALSVDIPMSDLESTPASSDDGCEPFSERSVEEDNQLDKVLDDDSFGCSLITDDLKDNGRDLSAEEMLGEDFECEASKMGHG